MALFDTLKVARELQKTFQVDQAEAIVRALTEVGDDTLVTKSDLAQFRAEVSARFSEVRKDLTSQIDEVRKDGASLKNELALFKVDTAKWIVGAIAFNLLGTLGIMLALVKLLAK